MDMIDVIGTLCICMLIIGPGLLAMDIIVRLIDRHEANKLKRIDAQLERDRAERAKADAEAQALYIAKLKLARELENRPPRGRGQVIIVKGVMADRLADTNDTDYSEGVI